MLASSVCQSDHSVAMVIRGARYATGPYTSVRGALEIVDGRILRLHAEPAPRCSFATEINLDGFLLLPGLINAHDHLQYALHPRLGHPPYKNYVEWGDDIHATMPAIIAQYKSVPRDVRLWWGGIRNLLSGVTTVCHHDPFWPALRAEGYPVRVLRDYGWSHSVGLSLDIQKAWAATPTGNAFFVHACEGTDELAREELATLDRLGALDERTVIVHGLALDEDGITLLRKRHGSLILCLSSNHFLYERLPEMDRLDKVENIALGNDSPLTATGDLLDEVRFAIDHTAISSDRMYRMITNIPATILRLVDGEGHIRESSYADVVAVRDNGTSPHKLLKYLSWRDVEFVMIAGEIRLASEDVWQILPSAAKQGMEPLWIEGDVRWLRAPIQQLLHEAEAHLGVGMIRLGGRTIQLVDPVIAASLAGNYQQPDGAGQRA